MRDPLSIASDGYLGTYKKTQTIATEGYLSVFSIIVITPDELTEGGVFPDYLVDDKYDKKKREEQELLLIIQIFMKRWH